MRRKTSGRFLLTFRNLYSFLSQILPFQDSDLEKLYTYLRFLHTKLPRREQSKIFDIEGDVALKYYRFRRFPKEASSCSVERKAQLTGPAKSEQAKMRKQSLSCPR